MLKTSKKVLAFALTLLMLMTSIPIVAMPAMAAEDTEVYSPDYLQLRWLANSNFLQDASGHGRNGSSYDTMTWNTSGMYDSLYFDGSNDRIWNATSVSNLLSAGICGGVENGGAGTTIAWMAKASEVNQNPYFCIFNSNYNTNGYKTLFSLAPNGATVYTNSGGSAHNKSNSDTHAEADGNWHTYVIKFWSSKTMVIWVDGVKQYQETSDYYDNHTFDIPNVIKVGGNREDNAMFKGYIRDFRIYNKDLDAPSVHANLMACADKGIINQDFAIAKTGMITGSGTRYDGSKFNIVNDQEAGNTSCGIIEYDISNLAGKQITSATFKAVVDSVQNTTEGDQNVPTGFYYSTSTNCATYVDTSGSKTSQVGGSGYGADTAGLDKMLGLCGTDRSKIIGSFVGAGNRTMDVKTVLQAAADAGVTKFYVVVAKTTAGGQGSTGNWTDTKVSPASQVLTIQAEPKPEVTETNEVYGNVNIGSVIYAHGTFSGSPQNISDVHQYDYMMNGSRVADATYSGEAYTPLSTSKTISKITVEESGQTLKTISVNTWDGKGTKTVLSGDLGSAFNSVTSTSSKTATLKFVFEDGTYEYHKLRVITNPVAQHSVGYSQFWTNTITGSNYHSVCQYELLAVGSYGQATSASNVAIQKNSNQLGNITSYRNYPFIYSPYQSNYVTYDEGKIDGFDGATDAKRITTDKYAGVGSSATGRGTPAILTLSNPSATYFFDKSMSADNQLGIYQSGSNYNIKMFVGTLNDSYGTANKAKYFAHSANGVLTYSSVENITGNIMSTSAGTFAGHNIDAKGNYILRINDTSTGTKTGGLTTQYYSFNSSDKGWQVDTSASVEMTMPVSITISDKTSQRNTYNSYITRLHNGDIREQCYTPETWAVFHAALLNLEDWLSDNTNTDMTAGANLATALNNAYNALVPVDDVSVHVAVHHNAQTATCKQIGWNAYDTCSKCTFTTYVEIPQSDHVWQSTTPTKVNGSVKPQHYYYCTLGNHYEYEYCTFTEVEGSAVAPTCTTPGKEADMACICGDTQTGATLEAKNHDWSSWTFDEATKTHSRVCANDSTHTESAACTFTESTVDSTCSAPGTKTYTCSTCGGSYTETIEKKDHTYGDPAWTWKTTNTAEAKFTCGACNHTETITATVTGPVTTAPTCVTPGANTYTASVEFGGTTYTDTNAIEITDPNAHSWGGWTEKTPGTCQTKAVLERTCARCSAKQTKDGEFDPTNHDSWGEWTQTKAPTCSAKGSEKRVCACGETETRETALDPTNHDSWGDWTQTKAPTCSAKGSEKRVCACGDGEETRDVAIDVNAHKWVDGSVINAATCVATGTKSMVCEYNSDHTKNVEISVDAEAHDWNDGIITTQPTCVLAGEKTYTCRRDGSHTKTEVLGVESEAHTWDEGIITTTATCKVEGIKTYTCANNSAHKKTENLGLDSTNHAWGDWTQTKAPTCSVAGEKERTCSACGKTEKAEVSINPDAHTWDEGTITTTATCKVEGIKTYTCANDATHKKTENLGLAADVHKTATRIENKVNCSVVDGTVVATSCKDDGTYDLVTYCSDCDKVLGTESKTVEKKAHTVVTDAKVDAVCGTDGRTEGSHCSVCGTVIVAQETIPALEHEYTKYVSNGDATCTQDGTETATCDNGCGTTDTKTDTGSKKEHSYTVYTSNGDATCTQDGTKTATCDNGCGTTDTQKDTGSALGHDMTKTEAVTATCQAGGNNEYYTCGRCSKVFADAQGKTETTVEAQQTAENPDNHTRIVDIAKVDATCETAGSTAGKKCADCGTVTLAPEVISALNHDWELTDKVDSTCSTKGSETYVCKNDASHTKTEELTFDASNHEGETEVRDDVEAKCGVAGYTGDTYCKACNTKIATGSTITALEHNYVEVAGSAINASCTTDGKEANKKCTLCGDIITGATIGATGHAWQEKTPKVDSTCKQTGTEAVYECSECHETKGGELIVKKSHTDENTDGYCDVCKELICDHPTASIETEVGKKAASCTENGYTGDKVCTKCSTILEAGSVITAEGHKYTSVVTDPTCVADGYTTHTCPACGDTYTDTVVTKLGHKYTNYVSNGDATCTQDGTETATCDNGCGTTDTQKATGSATDHDWKLTATVASTCVTKGSETYTCKNDASHTKTEEIALDASNHEQLETLAAVAPTCEDTGLTEGQKCAKCGKVTIAQAEVVALDHDWELTDKVDSTCSTKGSETYTCKNDASHTKTVELALDASNHEGETEVRGKVDAKCGVDGYTGDTYCKACNTKIADGETIVALEHNYVEVADSAIDASCTTDGKKANKKCSLCGDIITGETIGATGHKWVETSPMKDSTCSETGTQAAYECSECHETKGGELIVKKSHTDEDNNGFCDDCEELICEHPAASIATEVGKKDVTCTEDGYTGDKVCTKCNTILEAGSVITAEGHKYTSVVTDPTCVADGYTTHTCPACGDTYTDTIVPTSGHSYVDIAGTAVASTCKTAGKVADKKCSKCDDVTTGSTLVLDPTNHEGDTEVRDATDAKCEVAGYTGDTYCKACNTKIADGETISALEHKYTNYVSNNDATCLADGTKTATCDNGCGTEDTKPDTGSAIGHKFTDYKSNNDATCLADGTKTAICDNGCGTPDTKTDTGSKKEHSYTGAVRDNGNGTHSFKCVNGCNNYGADADCELVGTADTSRPATCTENGYTNYECSVCGYTTEKADIPATGHSYMAPEWTWATNGKSATLTFVCSADESHKVVVPVTVAADDVKITKAATCTSKGETTYTATYVVPASADTYTAESYTQSKTVADIEKLDHSYTVEVADSAVASTCKTAGKAANMKCTTCDDVKIGAALALDPTNHEGPLETRDAKDVKCNEAGYTGDTWCLACNKKTEDGSVIPTIAHTEKTVAGHPATCTQAGLTDGVICEACGTTITEQEIIPATGHHYGTTPIQPEIPSTCENPGTTAIYKCNDCDATTGGTAIPQKEHTDNNTDGKCDLCGKNICDHSATKVINKVDVTCTADGYTGDVVCDICGVVITAGTTVSTTGHNYVDVVTQPTCTTGGFTTWTCSKCGDSYISNHVAANGHSFTNYVSNGDAKCGIDGTKTAKCDNCDATNTVTDSGSALEHSFTKYVPKYNATCTTNCTEIASCDNGCGQKHEQEIPDTKLGHDWQTVAGTAVEAGCLVDGKEADKECSRCHEVEIGATITAPGAHTPETIPAVEATCTTAGSTAGSKCSVCGTILVAPTATNLASHTEATRKVDFINCKLLTDGTVIATTCDKNKNCTYVLETYCTECSKSIKTQTITVDKLEHTIVTDVAVAPTCEETGLTAGKHCSACDEVIVAQTVVSAKGHTHAAAVKENVIEASCSTKGEYDSVVYCSVCSKELSRTTVSVDMIDHTPAAAVEEDKVDSTCSAEGSYKMTVYCSVCSTKLSSESFTIEKKEHKWNLGEQTKAPTCSAEGEKKLTCVDCGATTTVAVAIDVNAHKWDDGVESAPTCSTNGDKVYTCQYNSAHTKHEAIITTGHSIVHHDAKAATCTQDGWKAYDTCANCDVYNTKVILPAKGHQAIVLPAVETTCTADGLTEGSKCSVCGEILVPQVTVSCTGHKDVVVLPAVEATCEGTGLTEGSKCNACGEVITAQTEISAKNHTVVEDAAVEPTCTQTGLTAGTHCSVCDKVLVAQTSIPAKGHTTVIDTAVAATCTTDGKTEGSHCSVCDVVFKAQTVVPATGHSYTSSITTAPSCTLAGEKTFICSKCGDTYTSSMAANGHKALAPVIEGVVESTCTTAGYHYVVVYCDVCGDVLSKTKVDRDLLPHTDVNKDGICDECGTSFADCQHTKTKIVGAVAATCKDKGYTGDKVCVYCNAVVETGTVIELLTTHKNDVGTVVKKATCTANGVYRYTCEICGATTDTVIYATGHKAADEAVKEVVKLATCTAEGSYNMVIRCVTCNAVLSSTSYKQAKLPHDELAPVKMNIVEPTCLVKGSYDLVTKCKVCGQVTESIKAYVDALGHDYVENAAQAATCTQDGWNAYTSCSRCDYSTQVIIPAFGHTLSDAVKENVIPATCTQDGSYESVVYCATCGDELSRNTIEIKAPGHSEVTTIPSVKATCTTDGCTAEIICSVCGEILNTSVVLPAKGHKYSNTLVPETCTTDGYTRHDCIACGYSCSTDVVPATGHTVAIDAGSDPTCVLKGKTEGSHCSKCKTVLVKQEIIPAIGHTDSNKDDMCDVCGHLLNTTNTTKCNGIAHKNNFFGKLVRFIYTIFWKLFKADVRCCSEAQFL